MALVDATAVGGTSTLVAVLIALCSGGLVTAVIAGLRSVYYGRARKEQLLATAAQQATDAAATMLSEYRTQLAEFRHEVDGLTRERNALRARVTKLEHDLERAINQHVRFDREIARLRAQLKKAP